MYLELQQEALYALENCMVDAICVSAKYINSIFHFISPWCLCLFSVLVLRPWRASGAFRSPCSRVLQRASQLLLLIQKDASK